MFQSGNKGGRANWRKEFCCCPNSNGEPILFKIYCFSFPCFDQLNNLTKKQILLVSYELY